MKDLILRYRWILICLLQFGIILASFFLAHAVRFDFHMTPYFLENALYFVPALLVIKISVFWKMGLFQGWWRYVSMPDLINILKANVYASIGFVFYAFFVHRLVGISRSTLVLDGIFCFLFMGGVRFMTRTFREYVLPPIQCGQDNPVRVLIFGAGVAGQMIVREIRQNSALNLDVVAFVDDDRQKWGLRIQGFSVLGGQLSLPVLCKRYQVDEVFIAIPSASSREIRSIVERCQASGVNFKTLPSVGNLINGRVSIQHIRDVNFDDLLGRETRGLDVPRIESYLAGKRVLITGAGGSIGSEICRQVALFSPAKLILFENAETPLFTIERELVEGFPNIPISPIIGDVRHMRRVEAIFDEFMPEVVFHAAAYKHVPMMEYNPAEAANNNVIGTRNVSEAADAIGAERFVLVSTDKAVNPTNVMGATKRAAELYVQALARRSRTQFLTVRFGNVLGSNGSVIPTFQEQINKGGPLTVTHPEVTRFFMTIAEATQLVLQAASMGGNGEVFLLDMGEPVRIVNLAEELIRLSGLEPYEDIDIVFTGLRPGEKLYEELLLAGENIRETSHEKIRVVMAAHCDEAHLATQIVALREAVRAMDLSAVKRVLQQIVPEYQTEDGRVTTKKVILHPSVKSESA